MGEDAGPDRKDHRGNERTLRHRRRGAEGRHGIVPTCCVGDHLPRREPWVRLLRAALVCYRMRQKVPRQNHRMHEPQPEVRRRERADRSRRADLNQGFQGLEIARESSRVQARGGPKATESHLRQGVEAENPSPDSHWRHALQLSSTMGGVHRKVSRGERHTLPLRHSDDQLRL